MHVLMVPGIDGSGDEHWQTLWELELGSAASRIAVGSWSRPVLADWTSAIGAALDAAGGSAVVVAHSLGCLAVVDFLVRSEVATGSRGCAGSSSSPGSTRAGVAGAFLIAPPDRNGPDFPADAATTFLGVVDGRLPVPGLLVTSDDDRYCRPERAAELALRWQVPTVSVGAHGHLNSSSGLGRWAEGRRLLTAFTAGLQFPREPSEAP